MNLMFTKGPLIGQEFKIHLLTYQESAQRHFATLQISDEERSLLNRAGMPDGATGPLMSDEKILHACCPEAAYRPTENLEYHTCWFHIDNERMMIVPETNKEAVNLLLK